MRSVTNPVHFLVSAVLAGALVSGAHAQRPNPNPDLEVAPCTVPGVEGPARCGTLRVWENRGTRSGRKIPIRFVVLPATGPTAARDAIVPLAGGPGASAVAGAAGTAWQMKALRGERDLLIPDQRGVGGSNSIECELYGPPDSLQDYLGDWYPAGRVAACAARLADSMDVRAYTSDAWADDLDELRAALGYERLDLFGTSYGTRAALVYMRRHPQRARAAVLLGSLPTDARMPVYLARDAQRSIDGVFADCAAQPACNAAFPDLPGSLRGVVDRLTREPATVTVLHPKTLETVTVRLSRDLFGEALRYMLYNGSDALLVPAVVHQAAHGDLTPLAEHALLGRREIVGGSSAGVYLSVTCAEDLPFVDSAEAARLAEGTFLGDYRVRHQRAACGRWPPAVVPRGFLAPVTADVPTLLLSGSLDPVTPPSQGDSVAAHLPRARHVVIPGGAHGFDGLENGWECANAMIARFLRDADPAAVDASCVATVRRPPFFTGRLELRPVAMAPADATRLLGTYRGPFELKITDAGGGRLRMEDPGGRTRLLVPVGPDRFRIADAPFARIRFVMEEGEVKGLRTTFGGGPESELLARVP